MIERDTIFCYRKVRGILYKQYKFFDLQSKEDIFEHENRLKDEKGFLKSKGVKWFIVKDEDSYYGIKCYSYNLFIDINRYEEIVGKEEIN